MDTNQLVSICDPCHDAIEFKDGAKVSLAEANAALAKLQLS